MASQYTVDVWPENWHGTTVFQWLITQWNVGPGGYVGLRYEAFPEARLRFSIPPEDWPELCDCLQVMEGAALTEIRKG